MATARQKSGLRGLSNLRLALKRLPVAMRREIGEAVADSAVTVHADMYTFAPKDTARTASFIESKMGADKLSARIGFLKYDDRQTRQGFVARFIEFGTKGINGQGAQPPRPFIQPALLANETTIIANIRAAISKAIGGTRLGKAYGFD